jgi:hypothetical protein
VYVHICSLCHSLTGLGINSARSRSQCIKLHVKYFVAHFAVIVLLGSPCYSGSPGPDLQPSANNLMRDVVANELTDRTEHSNWMYRVTKVVEQQTLTQIEVETKEGPVHRLLTVNDAPLDSARQQQETARQEQLVRDPSQQLAVKKQNDADELRLENFVRLMPSAFLFEYDGWEGPDLRLSFRPDPTFVPPTMESKALQSMAGTILVSPQQKRLARMNGHLVDNVDFGFGILGRIAKGGTFDIERIQVSSSHWKTHLVDIHVNGRMLLFKTINKQQHETRSDFVAVSNDLDLRQAEVLLQSRPY